MSDFNSTLRSMIISFGLGCVTTLLAYQLWNMDWKKGNKLRKPSGSLAEPKKGKPLTELPKLTTDDESYTYQRRRTSVAGESYNPADEVAQKRVVHPKSAEARKHLMKTVQKNLLMRNLDLTQKHEIIDAMFEKKVNKGENIITQGDDGDFFYVVESGHFAIFVDGKKVAESHSGGSFGELALLYGTPRAATVQATEESNVWCVDRVTFRRIVMNTTFKKRKRLEASLREVEIFKSLSDEERVKLADALQPVHFDAGEEIIKEGELGDNFYIVDDGEVEVSRINDDGEQEILKNITKGGYFGEIALLTDGYRMASVTAKDSVECLVLDKASFDRLLGPCVDILKRNMTEYKKYKKLVE